MRTSRAARWPPWWPDLLEDLRRRTTRLSPLRWWDSASGPRMRRSRSGCGEQGEDDLPQRPVRQGAVLGAAVPLDLLRVASMSLSYCTPDGHTVTQATSPGTGRCAGPSRGGHGLALEALLHEVETARAGSPSPRLVRGSGERQCTQSSMRSREGGWWSSKAASASTSGWVLAACSGMAAPMALVHGAHVALGRARRLSRSDGAVLAVRGVASHQIPPTKRPGARWRPGSSRCLMPRMSSSLRHRAPHVQPLAQLGQYHGDRALPRAGRGGAQAGDDAREGRPVRRDPGVEHALRPSRAARRRRRAPARPPAPRGAGPAPRRVAVVLASTSRPPCRRAHHVGCSPTAPPTRPRRRCRRRRRCRAAPAGRRGLREAGLFQLDGGGELGGAPP